MYSASVMLCSASATALGGLAGSGEDSGRLTQSRAVAASSTTPRVIPTSGRMIGSRVRGAISSTGSTQSPTSSTGSYQSPTSSTPGRASVSAGSSSSWSVKKPTASEMDPEGCMGGGDCGSSAEAGSSASVAASSGWSPGASSASQRSAPRSVGPVGASSSREPTVPGPGSGASMSVWSSRRGGE